MAAKTEIFGEAVLAGISEEQKIGKEFRRRKKRLLNSIREQIEFYLSDANLRKDRYLQNLMKSLGDDSTATVFIPVKEFLKFNKIKSLTEDEKFIARAVKSSQYLELNDTETEIRRKIPVNYEVNTDSCTIYVEGLPAHADHSWIRTHFGRFGEITYISLPCFKSNGAIKGFAFIEFKSCDSVVRVCKRFGSEIPQALHQKEPDVLMIFEDNNAGNKRPHEPEPQVLTTKKQKTEAASEQANVEADNLLKNKTKKKNRRKLKDQCERVYLNDELEMKNLRVMSKHEWLEFKKKYVELQRSQMSAIKKSLIATEEIQKESKWSSSTEANRTELSENKCVLSGVVLKLTYKINSVDEFVESIFRKNIREVCGENVAYIDLVKEEVTLDADIHKGVCYIRFRDIESAEQALRNERVTQLGELTKLSSTEESEYWNRIQDCLRKKKLRERKKRGVDRMTERVDKSVATKTQTKVNTHIKFE